jgi:hypothetical protein
MTAKALSAICLCVVLSTAAAWGADEDPATDPGRTGIEKGTPMLFDRHVDTWAEGTITAIDAENNKFTIRGMKMPYATAYAAMMKDLSKKTEGVTAADRQKKEEDVRRAWTDRLAKAKNESEKETDYTFSFPKDGKISLLTDRDVQNVAWLHQDFGGQKRRPEQGQPTTFEGKPEAGKTAGEMHGKELAAATAIKEFKIGERVQVGYDSGLTVNDAYAIVKMEGGRTGTETGKTERQTR